MFPDRCRDSDKVFNAFLKDEPRECCPRLLSSQAREGWIRGMLTQWLSMVWYPFLFLKFFLQLIFPCTCTPSLHLHLFLRKTFYFPCFFNFYRVQAAQSCETVDGQLSMGCARVWWIFIAIWDSCLCWCSRWSETLLKMRSAATGWCVQATGRATPTTDDPYPSHRAESEQIKLEQKAVRWWNGAKLNTGSPYHLNEWKMWNASQTAQCESTLTFTPSVTQQLSRERVPLCQGVERAKEYHWVDKESDAVFHCFGAGGSVLDLKRGKFHRNVHEANNKRFVIVSIGRICDVI